MAGGRSSGPEMPPLVSITLPCYRQLDLARRAIDSIRSQTYSNLEITLLDDAASDEYAEFVRSLDDPRVRYFRNPQRLGAMHNMFAAITAGHGEYSMAFHEDDLLSSGYIAAAVGILDSNPSCGFVACQLQEFREEPTASTLSRDTPHPVCEQFPTAADLVR